MNTKYIESGGGVGIQAIPPRGQSRIIRGMKRSLILATLGLLFFSALPAAAGPVFAPGTKLFVIKTEHFDIIFSDRSRPTALRLSTMAESVYEEVSGKIQSKLPSRVPVVITPDIGSFNGETAPFPYMHIVLIDSALDLGWTAFKDNFRNLFLHELTHAVSLQIKAPWASFLSGIFGSWVLPGLLNEPEFMVEGVAVSFESDDAFGGRANDPLIKEQLRQDILENRFKSPIEASGLYDEYPYGDIYYEYGGLFNAYIQKAYGMGKYAELWKAMGDLIFPTSLDPYDVSFYKAFHKTYGIPFMEAWADFRNAVALASRVAAPERIGPRDLAAMPGGLCGDDRNLYWVDARSNRAMMTDASTLESSALFDADSTCAISDVSRDGGAGKGRLLVSRSVMLPDGRSRAETIAYDLASRRFLPETGVADMREARFFRDGWVGVVSDLHNTDLVFASAAGEKLLLPGSEEVMYSSPAVLDDRRLALIVAVGGKRSIGVFDADSGKLALVKPTGADAELLSYVRQISASGDETSRDVSSRDVSSRDVSSRRIYFNYDSNDGLYRLGILDGDELRVETTEYSGGIFWPRAAAGRVFYVGRFSGGDKLCRYPGDAASIGSAGTVGERRADFSLEDFDPKPALAERDAGIAAAAATTAIGPYRPLAYANPFQMWAPYPDLQNIDRSVRVFGLFYLQDPIAANGLLIDAGYDSSYPFADSSLEWVNDELPVAFTTTLGDNLVYGASGPPERQSSASLFASLDLPSTPLPRAAVLGLGGGVLTRGEGAGGSPYSWGYTGWNATFSGLAGWEGRIPGVAVSTSRGIDILSYHDLDAASLTYKTEARLVAAYDRVPIRLDLWGAWASSPVLKLDSTSTVFSADHRPPYVEYETLDTGSSNLLIEGTLAYRLADQAIHTNILDLYFNRLLVDIGFRAAYFQTEALDSAFARLSLDIAGAQGLAYAGARIFGEAFARLDQSVSAASFGFRLGYQLDADSGTPLRAPLSAPPLPRRQAAEELE